MFQCEGEIYMFKLTQEQIEEIIESYGGSLRTIKKIELLLNQYDCIRDEEQYYELVISVLAQHQTIRLKMEKAVNQRDRLDEYMGLEEIIDLEFNRIQDELNPNKTFRRK